MSQLILSSATVEGVVKLLNERFYSTTYAVNESGVITWKGGEPKTDMILIKKRGRFQVYQSKS